VLLDSQSLTTAASVTVADMNKRLQSSDGASTSQATPPAEPRSRLTFVKWVLRLCPQWLLDQAATEAGYSTKGYGMKLKDTIIERGTLEDAKRSGRPPSVYTNELLEEAWDTVTAEKAQKYNVPKLLHKVLSDGMHHSAVKFWAKLKQYAQRLGYAMRLTKQTVFYLKKEDRGLRVRFCVELLALLTRGDCQLIQIAFEDETHTTWPGHPKGK
jgi:hypothetical protein